MEKSLWKILASVYFCTFKIALILLWWAQLFEWDCDHLLPKAIAPNELELGLVGNIKVFSSSSFFWKPTHWAVLLIASLRLTNKKKQTKQFASLSDTVQKNDSLSYLKVHIFVFFSSYTRSYRGIWKFSFFFFWLSFFGGQDVSECYKPC